MNFSTLRSSLDRMVIEFQGGLMKVSLKQNPAVLVQEGPHDVYAKIYRREFDRFVAKLPSDRQVRIGGVLVGAQLTSDELEQIEKLTRASVHEYLLHSKSTRGAVTSFSRRSRSRLMQVVARLKPDCFGLFVTLTYRANQTDHEAAKRHLDLMLRWLKRHAPLSAILWRMEYQRRGAIHFHLIIFGASFLSIDKLTSHWQRVTHDDSYPDIERITSRKKALGYVSKYLAKLDAGAGGLDNLPYSEMVGDNSEDTGDQAAAGNRWVGRFWGIVNRKYLPYDEGVRLYIVGDAGLLLELRRYASKHWRKFRRWGRIQGFALFCDAAQWKRLFDWIRSEDDWLDHRTEELPLRTAPLMT